LWLRGESWIHHIQYVNLMKNYTIDEGSRTYVVNIKVIEKIGFSTVQLAKPYKLRWLFKDGKYM